MTAYWKYQWRLNTLLKGMIAIVSAHIILSLGEPEPLSQLIFLPEYRSLLLPNVLLILLIIISVWAIHIFCFQHSAKHWILILFAGMVLPLTLAYGIAFLYFWVLDVPFESVNYWNGLFPVTLIFVFLMNLYEFFWLLRYRLQQSAQQESVDSILIQHGRYTTRLPLSECGYFERNAFQLTVYDLEANPHTPILAFEQILKILPPDDFFRNHRNLIVRRQIIRKVWPGTSRTHSLELDEVFGVRLPVSQRLSTRFKHWYGSG